MAIYLIKKKLEPVRLAEINLHCDAAYQSMITAESKIMRQRFLTVLEEKLKKLWPEVSLKPYGSYSQGTALPQSDMDVCVILDGVDNYKSRLTSIQKIHELLENDPEFKDLQHRVTPIPMVAGHHTTSKINFDLTINNFQPLYNAKFIKYSLSVHPLAQQFVMILKLWVRKQHLKDNLSSMGFILMSIFFFQKKRLLPPLPEEEDVYAKMRKITHQNKDLYETSLEMYLDDIKSGRNIQSFEGLTIGELLYEFFSYYLRYHDYNKVISTRHGFDCSKRHLGWEDGHPFAIMDVFLDEEKGTVDPRDVTRLTRSFRSAVFTLESGYLNMFVQTTFQPEQIGGPGKMQGVMEEMARKVAKDVAQEAAHGVAKDVAQEVAKKVAQEVAKKVAQEAAQKVAKDVAQEVAQGVAQKVAKDVAQEAAQKVAKDVVIRTDF